MGEDARTWSRPASDMSARPAHGFPLPHVDVHGQTDIGRTRTTNADQFLIADLDRWLLIRQDNFCDGSRWSSGDQGKLLAVASGVVGSSSGHAASVATIDSVAQYITSTMSWTLNDPVEDDDRSLQQRVVDELCYVLPRCQHHLRRVAEERGIGAPHSSTLTLAYVLWPDLYVVHAGSSRCYLFRDGYLRQITWERPDSRASKHSGRVVDVYGADRCTPQPGDDGCRLPAFACTDAVIEHPRADVHHVSLCSGDQVLLCTEGITHYLHSKAIAAHLRAEPRVTRACGRLIRAAKRAGGADSMTAVLARFT